MPTLDVIVVNWNSGDLLRDCLRSLREAMTGRDEVGKVVVVDNASSDGSLRGLELIGLPLSVLRNDANRGFGAACNQGASGSAAECLLFLNADVRLGHDSIGQALGFLDREASREVGIVGVQLVDERGRVMRTCSRFPSVPRLCSTSLGLDRLLPRVFPGLRMREWDHADSRTVDQVMGAFFLVRAELFRRLGGFDERFFMYFEDVDFAYRAARVGMRSYYLASGRAHHPGGGSSSQVPALRLFYSLRSRLLYARKHLGRWRCGIVMGFALCLEPLARCLGDLLRGSPSGVATTIAAYRLLLNAGSFRSFAGDEG